MSVVRFQSQEVAIDEMWVGVGDSNGRMRGVREQLGGEEARMKNP